MDHILKIYTISNFMAILINVILLRVLVVMAKAACNRRD